MAASDAGPRVGSVTTKRRVGLGVEPFMLRSALYRHLSRSGEFELRLLGPDESGPDQAWSGVDAVVVSEVVEVPGARVIVVSDATQSVEIHEGGRSRVVPYRGLAWLASLLTGELSAHAG
jgi:hypothetical protein